ncbi:hypothetical protein KKG31_00570 [Patescibacteria group bacterium]|nr:hypothetical protein [Patescibacteria group bacterium]MBU1757679.1 hypothetical protein [Patescibacteria group bacterium]
MLPSNDPRINNYLAKADNYQKQITVTELPKQEVKKEVTKQEIKKEVPIEVKKEVPIEVKKEIPKQEVVEQELPKDVLVQIEAEEKIIVQESQNWDDKFDIKYFNNIKSRYTKILTNVDKSLQIKPNDKNLITKKNEIQEDIRNVELKFRTEKEIVAWYKRQELMSDGKVQKPQYMNIADFLLGIKYLQPAVGYEKFCREDYMSNKQKPINEIVFEYALGTIESINKGKKL